MNIVSVDKAFIAYVRGQSEEVGFKTVSQPGFEFLSGYVEFWLRFIGVRNVVSLTVEHSWDGRAVEMIDAVLAGREWLAGTFSVAGILMADELRLGDRLDALAGYPACRDYVARHGPPVLREGASGLGGAFRRGGLSNTGAKGLTVA